MPSTTAEIELNEEPNAIDNSSDDAVPQAPVEEQVIADETVLLEESVVVEEVVITHREEVLESRQELEEGECKLFYSQ